MVVTIPWASASVSVPDFAKVGHFREFPSSREVIYKGFTKGFGFWCSDQIFFGGEYFLRS